MGSDASKELTYRREAGPNAPALSQQEISAIKKRRPKSRQALLNFLRVAHPALADEIEKHVSVFFPESASIDGPADALPRIGVAVSGGGWRAMTAGIAVADELSRIGLLDAVEVVSGVSGGSWFIQNWALGGTNKNVFHNTSAPHDQHPWAYGNRFQSSVHRYEGLIRMLSEKVVHRSAHIPRHLEIFGKFAEFVTSSDLTFFRLLLLSSGGKSMISRYASFLDQQLLLWQTAEERKHDLLLQNEASAKGVSDGTFPMFVVAAIDTVDGDVQTPSAQVGRSKNVWTEFTPFGARSRNIDFGSTQSIITARMKMDDKVVPVTVGRLMGVCGSAFAFDEEQMLKEIPSGLARLARFFGARDDETKVVLKNALTRTYVPLAKSPKKPSSDVEDVLFGQLRDAGLDINIPFPLMLTPSSGRKFDMLLAFDAGYLATSAAELATAVEYGYIEIEGETVHSLKSPFESGERVRVFYPPVDQTTGQRKGPIIVYVLVLNTTRSTKIVFTRDEVIACTSFVRQVIRDQVALEVARCVQKYSLDQLEKSGKIDKTRRGQLEGESGLHASPFLSGSDVVLDPSGELDRFRELSQKAIQRLLFKESSTDTIHLNPLDVVQNIERELLSRIPADQRANCIRRVAELAAVAASTTTNSNAKTNACFRLNVPLSIVDNFLLASGWIIKSTLRSEHTAEDAAANFNAYEFVDKILLDYALAVCSVFEMISFVEGQDLSVPTASLKSLTKSLNRDASLVLPVAANSPRVMPAAHQGQGLTEVSWRFVFTYMSMLVSVPDEGSVKLSQKLIEKIGRDSQALLKKLEVPQPAGSNKSAGALLTAVANLSLHDCLRYDKREEVRRQLGLSVVIESFCFLIVGQESCITNEALLTLWKQYFDGDASGRFSFFALEAILFSARGIRCRSIVNSLLPKAKAFIASVAKNEDQGLLSVALYCSSFRNAGNIEILRKAGIVGSIRENPAQCCTLLDACLVGNHNAVEMILYENVNGAPPIEAVKISVEKKFPKCVDALITDDEVTKQFLLQAQGILQEAAPQEFDAQKKSVGDLVARH